MFEQYYSSQLMKGGGNIFQGAIYQRGYGLRGIQGGFGIGGVFMTLFHFAKPLLSSGVKLLGDLATET